MTDLLPEPADGRRVVVYRSTPFARSHLFRRDDTYARRLLFKEPDARWFHDGDTSDDTPLSWEDLVRHADNVHLVDAAPLKTCADYVCSVCEHEWTGPAGCPVCGKPAEGSA